MNKGANEMTHALSARRRLVAAATATAAIGATLVIASSATAATSAGLGPAAEAHGASATHDITASRAAAGTAGRGQGHRRMAGRSIPTLFATVRVFSAPGTSGGAVKGKISGRGTTVSVTCWTTGAFYQDEPIWYEVSAPVAGYVSAFNLLAHYSPAAGVPHCVAPVFKEQFNALEPDLHIRTGPSTTDTITGHLVSVGSRVTVECFVKGTPIFDDPIWYRAVAPHTGYLSGRLLNTGGDPAPGVPHC